MSELYNKYLAHHGILGQKWGIRRYQNKDGTLTPLGRKRLEEGARLFPSYNGKMLQWNDKRSTNRNRTYEKYRDERNNGTKQEFQDWLSNTKRLSSDAKKAEETGDLYDYWKTNIRDKETTFQKDLKSAKELIDEYAEATLKDLRMINTTEAKEYAKKVFIDSDITIRRLLEKEKYRNLRNDPEYIKELNNYPKDTPQDIKKRSINIVKNFKNDDEYMGYSSETFNDIGNFKDVRTNVSSSVGNERQNAIKAAEFIKRFDSDKALEGLAKEYYDSETSWIDNRYTRDEFKKKVKLDYITIDPENLTYEAWYDDGGTYGYHSFVDEGNLKTMKVMYRSLEG